MIVWSFGRFCDLSNAAISCWTTNDMTPMTPTINWISTGEANSEMPYIFIYLYIGILSILYDILVSILYHILEMTKMEFFRLEICFYSPGPSSKLDIGKFAVGVLHLHFFQSLEYSFQCLGCHGVSLVFFVTFLYICHMYTYVASICVCVFICLNLCVFIIIM